MRLTPSLRTTLAALAVATSTAAAQRPNASYADAFDLRRARTDPVLRYVVQLDPAADSTSYRVTLEVRNAPDSLRLAFALWAPGAYRVADFGQYARDVRFEADGRALTVTRASDGSWSVRPPGDAGSRTLRVQYRVTFPSVAAATTPNNRSFLNARGALLDGPLTYAIPVGWERLPAHVRLELPAAWRAVTGLVPTADARTFVAPSVDVLLDSPVLAGPADALRVWPFAVDGVPHRVAYWRGPRAAPFDSVRFVRTAETAVRGAQAIMGELPYREYAFLYVDGGGGGLEHLNSTTIGAPDSALVRDASSRASVTAHEFFHLWNVKRLRPAELGPFDYMHPVRTRNLWWSEGVTDYFADEIVRRTGLIDSATAVKELGDALESWLNNPGATRVSPERSSWTAWDLPAVNDGFNISYYLQGKLLGELLELRLRDATDGRRGMDDLVRLLYERHADARGFASDDVLHAANDVCACDLEPVFDAHVRGSRPIDWQSTLALAGWRLDTTRTVVRDTAGRPRPDLRASATSYGGIGSAGGAAGGRPRLSLSDPTGAWYRAGLRGGDELVSVRGRPVSTPEAFRPALAGLAVGDSVVVEVRRAGAPVRVVVPLTAYETVRVRLTDAPTVTEGQRRLRALWLRGR